MSQRKQRSSADFRGAREPTWCPGCTYFGVLSALTGAFSDLGFEPGGVTVVSGIGCSSRLPLWLSTFGMHTMHGRALPAAIGARLSRPSVPVVVTSGDGDLFSIGIGHFIHAARRNVDLTVICLNNRMYAMTKNQASPTSARGYRGSLTPQGTATAPLNPIELAITSGATFTARSFAGDPLHMREMIQRGIRHRGFSFIDIVAPCRSFGTDRDVSRYRSRIIDIGRNGHDPFDRGCALSAASSVYAGDDDDSLPVPTGVFWEQGNVPVFEEQAGGKITQPGKVLESFFDDCDPGFRF